MPAGLEDAIHVDKNGNALPTGEYTEDHDVIQLDPWNWNKIVNKEKFMVVEFYAPWCGLPEDDS